MLGYRVQSRCYEVAMETLRVDPKKVRVRDYLLVRVITGATKAGVQVDRRKEASRKACRQRGWAND